jgi:hypothetical protein
VFLVHLGRNSPKVATDIVDHRAPARFIVVDDVFGTAENGPQQPFRLCVVRREFRGIRLKEAPSCPSRMIKSIGKKAEALLLAGNKHHKARYQNSRQILLPANGGDALLERWTSSKIHAWLNQDAQR